MAIDVQGIKDTRARLMFGMTDVENEADILKALQWQRDCTRSQDPASTLAVSYLSDAQEMISLGQKEEARHLLNRVKYLLLEQSRLLKRLP